MPIELVVLQDLRSIATLEEQQPLLYDICLFKWRYR